MGPRVTRRGAEKSVRRLLYYWILVWLGCYRGHGIGQMKLGYCILELLLTEFADEVNVKVRGKRITDDFTYFWPELLKD